MPAKLEGRTHGSGVAGKQTPPQPVRQDRDVWAAGDVLLRGKRGTEHGPHAEDVEELLRHAHRLDELGAVTGRDVETGWVPPGCQRLHRLQILAEEEVAPTGLSPLGAIRMAAHQLDDPIGLRVIERPQQYRIHDAEDRRVRADAERERHERRERKARSPDQGSNPVADVLDDRFEDRYGLFPRGFRLDHRALPVGFRDLNACWTPTRL